MRLPELQNSFAHGILNAPETRLLSLIDESSLSAADRLKAYRNNVYVGLYETLKAHFPILVRLVGEDFLRAAAHQFIKNHPPQTALLDEYGLLFAPFLSQYQPASSVPYLPDMARLDWAMHEASLAPDDAPLPREALQEKQDTLAESPLPLRRSLRLLQSPYPLKDIWHFCFRADQSEPLEINKKQRFYVVYRCDDFSSWFEEIEPATHAGLKSLLTGQTLTQALSVAAAAQAHFEPSSFLLFAMKRELLRR